MTGSGSAVYGIGAPNACSPLWPGILPGTILTRTISKKYYQEKHWGVAKW